MRAIICPRCKDSKNIGHTFCPKGHLRYHSMKFEIDETYKTKAVDRYTCRSCSFAWDEVCNEDTTD